MPKKKNETEGGKQLARIANEVKNLMAQQKRAAEACRKAIDAAETHDAVEGVTPDKLQQVKDYCGELMTVVTTMNVLAANLEKASGEPTPLGVRPDESEKETIKKVAEEHPSAKTKKPKEESTQKEADEEEDLESFFDL